MTFAAAVSMNGGSDPHAACVLAKWIDGLGCQEVTIRTDGAPGICEVVRRVRELRAEGTTTVDEISPPDDSAASGVAKIAVLTVGERAWRPRRRPAAHSMHGTPRSTGDLCLFSWHGWAHAVSTAEGAQVWHSTCWIW